MSSSRASVNTKLDQFKGRTKRDNWVEQTSLLVEGRYDEFLHRFGENGSELNQE